MLVRLSGAVKPVCGVRPPPDLLLSLYGVRTPAARGSGASLGLELPDRRTPCVTTLAPIGTFRLSMMKYSRSSDGTLQLAKKGEPLSCLEVTVRG